MLSRTPHSFAALALGLAALGVPACHQGESETPEQVQHREMPQREPQWISGQVMGVDQVPIEQYNDSTVHLTVATEGEQQVRLELGPGWYLNEQGVAFEPQQHIEFRGKRAGEGNTYVAHQLRKGQQTVDLRDDSGTPRWPNKALVPTPTAPTVSPAAPAPPPPGPPAVSQ